MILLLYYFLSGDVPGRKGRGNRGISPKNVYMYDTVFKFETNNKSTVA